MDIWQPHIRFDMYATCIINWKKCNFITHVYECVFVVLVHISRTTEYISLKPNRWIHIYNSMFGVCQDLCFLLVLLFIVVCALEPDLFIAWWSLDLVLLLLSFCSITDSPHSQFSLSPV